MKEEEQIKDAIKATIQSLRNIADSLESNKVSDMKLSSLDVINTAMILGHYLSKLPPEIKLYFLATFTRNLVQ